MKRTGLTLVVAAMAALVIPQDAVSQERVIPGPFQGSYEGFQYAPAVKAGGFLYLSGTVGVPSGPGAEGIAGAVETAFRAAGMVLDEAGYEWSDVIDVVSFHTDIDAAKEPFQEVKRRYLSEPWPTWTAIGIDRLWMPEAVVEVRFIAYREDGGRSGDDAEPEGGR